METVAGIPDMMIADTMAIRMAGSGMAMAGSAMRAEGPAAAEAISGLAAAGDILVPAVAAAGLRTITNPHFLQTGRLCLRLQTVLRLQSTIMPPSPDTDLTGTWHGQYSYPAKLPPEFFTATLLERPGLLGGSIQETIQHGKSAGKTLYASVHGRREGNAVTFTKTYETPPRRHSVQYEGKLNAEATEIEGRWTIPGAWSGRFLMIRSSFLAQQTARQVTERV
jgi:hypothetical protein